MKHYDVGRMGMTVNEIAKVVLLLGTTLFIVGLLVGVVVEFWRPRHDLVAAWYVVWGSMSGTGVMLFGLGAAVQQGIISAWGPMAGMISLACVGAALVLHIQYRWRKSQPYRVRRLRNYLRKRCPSSL